MFYVTSDLYHMRRDVLVMVRSIACTVYCPWLTSRDQGDINLYSSCQPPNYLHSLQNAGYAPYPLP